MKLSHRSRHFGSIAFALAVGFAGGIFIASGTGSVDAQNRSVREADPVVSYNARFVGEVTPGGTSIKAEEVFEFPGSPVFLFQTAEGITVWERTQGGGLRKLMDIPIKDEFKKVVFLDDKETFVIHTKKAASVYRINRSVTIPQN